MWVETTGLAGLKGEVVVPVRRTVLTMGMVVVVVEEGMLDLEEDGIRSILAFDWFGAGLLLR